MLIAIDGIDGAGKTTLAESLKRRLACLDPIIEKEPTEHSEWGRRLRESARVGRLPTEVELEYFHKDRIEHIQRIVQPALERGQLVILDRYVDSTLAFQARDVQDANRMYQEFLSEILVPNFTFILDCPPEIGLARIARSRSEQSQFERIDTLNHAETIYHSRQGPTYHHIDATRSAEHTLDQVLRILTTHSEKIRQILEKRSGTNCRKAELRAERL